MSSTAGPGRDRFAPDFLLDLFRNPLDPGYADAAARRAEFGPRPPWRRRGALGMRVVALMVVGFLLAVAYRTAVAAEPERTSAHAGLITQVKAAQAGTDQLQADSDRLRREVTEQQQAALGGTAEQLRQIQQAQAAAGLIAVVGPGTVVRLTDATPQIDPKTGKNSDADVSRVLDIDLQSVVNALWAAGAEAISINGQRLTALSTIRTAGTAVLVDFRPVTSPYEVSAIGRDGLQEAFDRSPAAATMRQLVDQYGLGLTSRTDPRLTLPAAPGPALGYAHLPATPTPTATR